MKKYLITLIIFLSINVMYGMLGTIREETLNESKAISSRAAQLMNSNIDDTTAEQWKELLEQAQQFQTQHPRFPHLAIARKSKQGPDAQSIAATAPLIINLLGNQCVTETDLAKIKRIFGDRYFQKLIATIKK